MSLPSPREIGKLEIVALELRETFAVEGYTIGKALDANQSFRSSESPRSALARTVALDGIERGANKAGIGLKTVSGGGRDLISLDAPVYRKYRVLRAKLAEDGSFRILVRGDSILQLDGDVLWREERWVFAYTLGATDQPDAVFVAEVLGISDTNPAYLILGSDIALCPPNTPPPGGRGFEPTDEGLDGFDDGEENPESDAG